MLEASAKTLFDDVPDALVICNPETGEILDANPQFTDLTGYDASEIRGESLTGYTHATSVSGASVLHGRLESVLDGGPERLRWTMGRRDDEPIALDLSLSESHLDGDRAVIVSARPVTAEGEHERELQQYRRRLDGAMFAGDLAWWEMDAETGAALFHENKAALLGYPADRFDHYEDFTELIHPDDYEGAMQAMRDHLEGEAKKYDTEYRIERRDGSYRWFHDIGGITQWTEEGTPKKVTGVVVDVTRRKEAQQRLRNQNEQLALLNRLVRHDIRNQMAVNLGWVEAIRDDLSADLRERVDRIVDASEHTIELTELSRDLMNVIVEEDSLALEPVGVRSMVTAEVEKARENFPEAEIGIDGELPAVEVRANALLSSVLTNLLNNAVQHNDKETPAVTVSVEHSGETVGIRIADNGPGIPDEHRETLLGRGEKGLDSDGTGLGLYLVDTLIDAYDGRLTIRDNDPEGTVFLVELDRA